ncbi:MAG: hypothetical protein FWC17_06410 [Treponema sp.]|nr:hypothetical protein [Treponema sp.]
MNTIPTTFNENITRYTAVGCRERIATSGISAIILNRSIIPRRYFFQELEKSGFDNVISIESSALHYDIEDLSSRFPFVRFILPENEINLGQQINLGVTEIESPLFYVLRSDMKIIAGGTARRMAERLSVKSEEAEEKKINADNNTGFKRLCTVPVIMNSNYAILPSLVAPMTQRKKMRTVYLEPHNEGDISLYPFDGIGIYDRQRFISLGGFDSALKNTHWQLMDFGFRAYLWGEEIALNLHLKLSYDGELPQENFTIEECYRWFYLKNLAPVFKNDYAHLPLYRFPGFKSRCGIDIGSAWEEFSESRKWVTKNKYRWKCDARHVAKQWDTSCPGINIDFDDSGLHEKEGVI